MDLIGSVKRLRWYEVLIWSISVLVITVSSLLYPGISIFNVIASLVGVTALIFVAKGDSLGQLLTVVFALLYGVVSYKFRYYGEMITYLGMTAPIALGAVVTWIRNPYKRGEVKVKHTTPKMWAVLSVLAALVTLLFYFVLRRLDTPNIVPSVISVTTSFMAASLTLIRSPYYGLFYAFNDIVLIVLWSLALSEDISYLPMVLCFACFLLNDIYGFINWQRMKIRQEN